MYGLIKICTFALALLALAGVSRAADDWNLFAAEPVAATGDDEWNLFSPAAVSDQAECQVWNLFACADSETTVPGHVPTKQRNGKYGWFSEDGRYWAVAALPADGYVYKARDGVRWEYRGGRMLAQEVKQLVFTPLTVQSGHFENRCVDGVCRPVWVP